MVKKINGKLYESHAAVWQVKVRMMKLLVFRFRVRFLLLVFVLLAVVFALLGAWVESAAKQKSAIKELENHRDCNWVFVFYDHEVGWIDESERLDVVIGEDRLARIPNKGILGWIAQHFGIDFVSNVGIVKFVDNVPDNAVELIKCLKNVRQIEIPSTSRDSFEQLQTQFPRAIVLVN